MPALVKLSVRERAMRAIEARLALIKRDNGYNIDLRHIHRTREMPQRADDPPELWIINEGTTIEPRSIGEIYETANFELWLVLPAVDSEKSDMWLNLGIADIQRALACGTVIDTLGPIDYEVDVKLGRFQPLYFMDGLVIGRMDGTARYWYLIDDPTRWDTADQTVEVEV